VKVIIDQFIQAPLLLAAMVIALSLMKGGGFLEAKVAMDQTFWTALIANCKSTQHGVRLLLVGE
jgi:hypothetical protein